MGPVPAAQITVLTRILPPPQPPLSQPTNQRRHQPQPSTNCRRSSRLHGILREALETPDANRSKASATASPQARLQVNKNQGEPPTLRTRRQLATLTTRELEVAPSYPNKTTNEREPRERTRGNKDRASDTKGHRLRAGGGGVKLYPTHSVDKKTKVTHGCMSSLCVPSASSSPIYGGI